MRILDDHHRILGRPVTRLRERQDGVRGLSAKLLSPAGQLATNWADDMCPTSRWGRSAKYSVDGDTPCNVIVPRSLVMLAAVWTNNASMSSS